MEAPSNLAEWFKTDPVERIVLHEKALRRTNSYTVDEDKWLGCIQHRISKRPVDAKTAGVLYSFGYDGPGWTYGPNMRKCWTG